MQVMEVKERNMHPLPTSQHFTAMRTDDDISAAVSQFLSNEGSKLQGKTWQDTTAEVTKWLGSQIQQEREGWRLKARAAMQEIENHRKEVLRYETIVNECTEQMRLVADCCNLPEETLASIEVLEPREALPRYIKCLTETLNLLMEDRIMCLQILRADEKLPGASLPSLLKSYIESLKHTTEKAHKEAKSRLDTLETANRQSVGEMQRLRKAIQRKQEEVEHLHAKLKEIKEVTLKSLKDVKRTTRKLEVTDVDDKKPQKDLPSARDVSRNSRRMQSSPSSLYSAPTPVPAIDKQNIQISEEKLSKLRRSAKKLENSLNEALTQMDTNRKVPKPSKANQTNMYGARPYGGLMNDLPTHLKKEMKLLPSPLHMWSTKFEVSGPQVRDAELEQFKRQEQEKMEKKQRAKERRKEALAKSQEKLVNSQDAPTFRSLMKSLEDVKKHKGKSYKPMGQVTKCLRCNKLFTLNDNHKKACNYHPKGKERIEQYSDRGKLVKVTYVWKCCMMAPDNPGCTYGQHV